MSDLILYVVKSLVTNPDAVSVDEQNNGGEVNLILTVDPADMGLVIGKSGQTIKALRKLLIVKAMAENVRVNLQLAEPEGGRPVRSEDQPVGDSAKSDDPQTDNPEETKTQTEVQTPDEAPQESDTESENS